MVDACHCKTSGDTLKNSLFEGIKIGVRLLESFLVHLRISSQQINSFVALLFHPSLILGRTDFGEIELRVANLLELVVCQIIVSSLEIHQVKISIQILDQWALLLKLKSTSTPENVQFLIERELVFCTMAKPLIQGLQ